MLRFRPNLVIEGSAPYAEDGWKRIRIGELEFEVAKVAAVASSPPSTRRPASAAPTASR